MSSSSLTIIDNKPSSGPWPGVEYRGYPCSGSGVSLVQSSDTDSLQFDEVGTQAAKASIPAPRTPVGAAIAHRCGVRRPSQPHDHSIV